MLKQQNLWEISRKTIFAVALTIMLLHFLIYVYYSLHLMRFPFDYDQGEGFELVSVMYLSEGRSPYTNNDVTPYFSDLYPLGYHLVLLPFAWVFGAALWYGRLVAFLGTLLTAGAIGWAIQREGKRRDLGLLLGLAFLASNYIYHIGPLFRQHYFMVMLEVVSVVTLANLFEVQDSRKQQQKLWIGLGLVLAALYTKQLAYPTAAAIFIWLFLRHPRRAVLSGIGFTLAGALIFAVLMLFTKGYWWENAFAANRNPYLYGQFRSLAEQFVRIHWVLLLFASLTAFYELYFARLSLYTIWWVAVTANTITAGKWGAGDSYFATSIAASCILTGIFIARTVNQSWTFEDNIYRRILQKLVQPMAAYQTQLWRLGGLASLVLMVAYGLNVIKMPTSGAVFEPISETLNLHPKIAYRYPLYDSADWTVGYALLGHLLSDQDYDNGWAIVDRVKATDQPVMTEDAMFSLLAGKEVIGNPVHLKNLYENGIFDPTHLVADIENQRFGLIILRAAFYPPPVVAAIYDAYHNTESIEMNGFSYQMWEAEPTWTTRQQIRNYLEMPPGEPLEITLPASVDNLDDWLITTMGRWAWLPVLQTESTPPGECKAYPFIRADQRATLTACEDQLRLERLE